MPRSKKTRKGAKTSMSQQVVGLATMGMPAPVQKVATNSLVSRLLILLVPILVASGVITISWNGGLPSFSIDRQRAEIVGEQVKMEAMKAAERVGQYGENAYR